MIPTIKRVFKQLQEFYSQDKNPPENWDNKPYALFGEFILLLSTTLITCIFHFFKNVAVFDIINCLMISVVCYPYYCTFTLYCRTRSSLFCPSLTTMVINRTTVLYKLYLNTSFDKNFSICVLCDKN